MTKRRPATSAQARLTASKVWAARGEGLWQIPIKAALVHQRQQVVEGGIGNMDGIPFALQGRQPGGIQHGGQGATRLVAAQQLALRLSRWKTQRESHGEAVELGLRQRIGARLIRRVLGGDDEKRIGEGMRIPLNAHLALGHRLQQGALHLGAGAVDLVRQQHLGEDGAG